MFCFSLTRGRVCGLQQKNTEHERVQFLGTTVHERGPYTHTTQQKHTLNTRGCLTRTSHGALKGTKAHTRTEKTLYTIPRCIIIHPMQMSDSVPFVVMYECIWLRFGISTLWRRVVVVENLVFIVAFCSIRHTVYHNQ